MGSSLTQDIQINEVPSLNSIPGLKAGRLCYVKKLSAELTLQGTFVHIENANTDFDLDMRFFDSSLKPTFYDGSKTTLSYSASEVQSVSCPSFDPAGSPSYLLFNSAGSKDRLLGVQMSKDPLTQRIYHTDVKELTTTSVVRVTIRSDDGKAYFGRDNGLVNDNYEFVLELGAWSSSSGSAPTTTTQITFKLTEAKTYTGIDMAFHIGSYLVFFLGDGTMLFARTTSFGPLYDSGSGYASSGFRTMIGLAAGEEFKPKFVRKDMSVPCDTAYCFAIAVEQRTDGSQYLTRMAISLNGATFSFEKKGTSFALPPAPVKNFVQLGAINTLLILTESGLGLYSITQTISADSDAFLDLANNYKTNLLWWSPVKLVAAVTLDPVSGIMPQIPIALLFDQGDTTFKIRMAKFSTYDGCISRDSATGDCRCDVGFYAANGACEPCRDPNCANCNPYSGKCVVCKGNFLLYNNQCLDCLGAVKD